MQPKKTTTYIIKLVLAVVLSCLPMTAMGQAPWSYEMSLQVETQGDSMYMPSAVAFDPETERYYVVDTGRSRLVSFDRNGQLLRAFSADEQLKSPFDLVRVDSRRLWVVEKGRNSVTYIDIPAKEVKPYRLFDGNRQVFPDRIAYFGNALYILDRASGYVLKLDDQMNVAKRYGCEDCIGGFADFVVKETGIYAVESRGKTVFSFDLEGNLLETLKLGDEIDFPVSLDIGPSGNIYILDRHHNSVLAYSEMGRFLYRLLGPGQAPGNVYFASQIRFDPWGRMCIVDEGNGRVEIYSR